MAQCAYCKAETQLYEDNLPVCPRCAKEPQRTRNLKAILFKALEEATERAADASEIFLVITGQIPSGIPNPDGTQKIHNASHQLSEARKEMMKAHARLIDYLELGLVPDDLKRSVKEP